MARYRPVANQPCFLPVVLSEQLLPGTFEFALNHLIDSGAVPLDGFDAHYRNDEVGAPAVSPAVLLKVVLLGYSRGLVSSRAIAAVFQQVLLVCDAQGLIGREMFAIDGVKQPGNASKRHSGNRGAIRKSNVTDNDSAKMATDKGVIQGYCGVATVDAAHQVIVEAQAHGTGSEQALLLPAVQAARPHMAAHTVITADAGYHSQANLQALAEQGVAAVIADNQRRQRDPRLTDQAKHRQQPDPLHDKTAQPDQPKLFGPRDFQHDPAQQRGYVSRRYRFQPSQCGPCTLKTQCLRKPETTLARQVAFHQANTGQGHPHTQRMRALIDSPQGRALYDRRMATVEPVFANLRHNKGLRRFTLRGQKKVDGQFKLFCLVHNIEKLAKAGYGMR